MFSILRKMPYLIVAIVLFFAAMGSAFAAGCISQADKIAKNAKDRCEQAEHMRLVASRATLKEQGAIVAGQAADNAQDVGLDAARQAVTGGNNYNQGNAIMAQAVKNDLLRYHKQLTNLPNGEPTPELKSQCYQRVKQIIKTYIEPCFVHNKKEQASSGMGLMEGAKMAGQLAGAAGAIGNLAKSLMGGDSGGGGANLQPGMDYSGVGAAEPQIGSASLKNTPIDDVSAASRDRDTASLGTDYSSDADNALYDPTTGDASDALSEESGLPGAAGSGGAAGAAGGGGIAGAGGGGSGSGVPSSGSSSLSDEIQGEALASLGEDKGLAYKGGGSGIQVAGESSGESGSADMSFDALDDGEMPLEDVMSDLEDNGGKTNFEKPVDIAGYSTKLNNGSAISTLFLDVKAQIREKRAAGNL